MDGDDLTQQAGLAGPVYGSDGGIKGLFVGRVSKVYLRTPQVVDVEVPFVGNLRSVNVARPNIGRTRFDLCPLEVDDAVLVAFVGGLASNPVVLMGVAPRGESDIPDDRNVKLSLFTARNEDGETTVSERRRVDDNGNVTYELEGAGGNVTIRLRGRVGNLTLELEKGDLNITVRGDASITTEGDAEVKALGRVVIDGESVELGNARAKVLTEETVCPYTGLPHRAVPDQKTEA